MQAKAVWRVVALMTTVLGAVSLMAQTGIPPLGQAERTDGQHDWDTFFGT